MINKDDFKNFLNDKNKNLVMLDFDVIEDLIEEANDMEKRFEMICSAFEKAGCDCIDYLSDEEYKFCFPEEEDEEDEEEDD